MNMSLENRSRAATQVVQLYIDHSSDILLWFSPILIYFYGELHFVLVNKSRCHNLARFLQC